MTAVAPLILLGVGAASAPAWAGGGTTTITTCTQKAFDKAVKKTGTVQFGLACSLTLTKTVKFAKSKNVTIEGNGFQVKISGGETVQLFSVSGGALSISGIELEEGAAIGAAGTNGVARTSGTTGGTPGTPGTAGVVGEPGTGGGSGGGGTSATAGKNGTAGASASGGCHPREVWVRLAVR